MLLDGLVVRRRREDAGLGLRSAAAAAMISPGYWSKIERGGAGDVSPQVVARLAGALGCAAVELAAAPRPGGQVVSVRPEHGGEVAVQWAPAPRPGGPAAWLVVRARTEPERSTAVALSAEEAFELGEALTRRPAQEETL